MHCGSCALLVENAVKKLSGIETVNVNFGTSKASIQYDESQISLDQIKKTIKSAGYEVVDNSKSYQDKSFQEKKFWFIKFLISAVFSLPQMFFMILVMKLWLPWENYILPRIGISSLFLSSFVQFVVWIEFYKWAWSALKMKTFNMYSLIAIWTSVAYLLSIYNLIIYYFSTNSLIATNGNFIPNLYFEVSSLLITFVCLWKYLESIAKAKTSEAVSKLIDLAPKTANLIAWENVQIINVSDIQTGDILLVKPWESIPVDGTIIKWSSSIDESMLTWESIPVEKIVWSKVFAGTLNKLGSFEFRVEKVWENTILSQIIKLIEQAQWSKAPIQSIADKISAVFVPVVILIAIFCFVVWYIFLWADLQFSLLIFASVIVIACPCALGLATPTAIMVGTWKAAQNWILIKWWEPLETACKIQALVFDKTGTLTVGKPQVTDFINLSDLDDINVLNIACSLEKNSEHPLADAMVEYGKQKWIKFDEIEDFEAYVWKWIQAKLNWKTYYIGTRNFLKDKKINFNTETQMQELENQGKTVILVSNEKEILWLIAITDIVKPNAKEIISKLKTSGIETYMLTWDNKKTAQAIASQIWILPENVLAEVLPQDKISQIKFLQEKNLVVGMVWDWINDAPALSQANVWFVMWSGSDVALESGDIVLMKNDLKDVIKAITLSKAIISKIKQNMFFALIYNVAWIPIAAGILFKFEIVLKPEIAGAAMALSSVSVVINSLILKWKKID